MSVIERTTKLATVVDDLPAAWSFVMTCIDNVGPAPSVHIMPQWWDSDGEPRNRFEVSVLGTVEDATTEGDA